MPLNIRRLGIIQIGLALCMQMLLACTANQHTTSLQAAETAFTQWAVNNSEPYQDIQFEETMNDGFFATIEVIAQFRGSVSEPWVEQEAQIECRKLGDEWLCDQDIAFSVSTRGLRQLIAAAIAQSAPTATAVAIATITAQALATATSIAQATLTASAMPTTIADAALNARELGFESFEVSDKSNIISVVNPKDRSRYVYVGEGVLDGI